MGVSIYACVKTINRLGGLYKIVNNVSSITLNMTRQLSAGPRVRTIYSFYGRTNSLRRLLPDLFRQRTLKRYFYLKKTRGGRLCTRIIRTEGTLGTRFTCLFGIRVKAYRPRTTKGGTITKMSGTKVYVNGNFRKDGLVLTWTISVYVISLSGIVTREGRYFVGTRVTITCASFRKHTSFYLVNAM